MKLFQNHRHLLFFIGSSLMLLAAVEFLWLRKLYNEGKEGIREDIEMRLKENATKLQIVYMQNMGTHLIDSFMAKQEKENKLRSEFLRKSSNIDITSSMIERQNTYLAKLDTLSQLPIGNTEDKAIIDSFLNKMREDYRKRNKFINVKPKNEEDSIKWIEAFLKNQDRAYQSLWYLYRLDYSPKLNHPLMDSFFKELRQYVVYEQKKPISPRIWHIEPTVNNTLNFNSRIIKDSNSSKVIELQHTPNDNIKIFVKGKISNGKNPSAGDSVRSLSGYNFQRYMKTLVSPEDIKHVLDSVFENSNLTFDVFKISTNELVPQKYPAVVATYPIGDGKKIAVASYGYQSLIFKNMATEILFAFFVLGITAITFWLIYRSFLQQKRLITLKNDFINNMTHELKTPITTVGVAIEAITNFGALNNPEQTKEYLDISKNELNRLSLMVDKVLKMAVFENAEAKLSIEPIDIADITQEVINSMRLQCDKYNATIHFNKIGDNFIVNADKVHITSVIYNLVDNALKYGGEKPDITIDIEPFYTDFMRLSVSDKGVGIPPQYQDKIFEKFFRVPTGDVHTVKGHGLGLNYVKNVIEQHGGKLHIESTEGKGSTFSVFLPLTDNQINNI
jgi:signal transduction histidine kinase